MLYFYLYWFIECVCNVVMSGKDPFLWQTYHLEVVDAAVDSGQHLLPLLWGLWTRVERGTEPVQIHNILNTHAVLLLPPCSFFYVSWWNKHGNVQLLRSGDNRQQGDYIYKKVLRRVSTAFQSSLELDSDKYKIMVNIEAEEAVYINPRVPYMTLKPWFQ